jgi:hypothetical protein
MLQRRGSSFINGSESVCVCVWGWVLCVCVVCRKKIKYVSPLHPLSSVGGKCPTTPWFQYSVLNKCSEVRSGIAFCYKFSCSNYRQLKPPDYTPIPLPQPMPAWTHLRHPKSTAHLATFV